MTEENRSVDIGRDVTKSVIIPGNRNTATITITNYYYREQTTVVPVESTDAADDNLPCPYRGLFHFGPDDAEFFFGREVFIEELFKATQTRNFIPLLGASGSGKSSVVLAGLVPKLQNQGNWLFTHFRPGSDPFHALALALVPLYTKNLDDTDKIIQARKLAKSLGNGEIPLADVFAQIHQNNSTHKVLLIADQFEEIYTLCADHKIRHSFLDILLATFPSSSTQSQCDRVLVATMRADFLANALLYRPFGDVLKNDIKLSSMNHDELTSVISKPAEKLQVTFESGLVERILDDVEDEPGNLPLLEFALTQLWKQRQGKLLTHAAYQAIGKVQGALARHADWNYGNYSAIEKERVRRIFIQLVQPGEGTLDTRRLATKAELGETSWDLVKHLADNRLVVTNQNAANQETVEVVHEALISNWDELRRWMNENRSFRAWQERLRLDMKRWHKMQQDKELLLRGKVLAEAEEKLKLRRDELSDGEKEFIQASVKLRDKEQKRRNFIRLGLISGSILIAILTPFIVKQWQQAEEKNSQDRYRATFERLKNKIADVSLVDKTKDWSITNIFVTDDNKIWMSHRKSTEEGLLIAYDLKSDAIKTYLDANITAIFARKKDIWLGVYKKKDNSYLLHGSFKGNRWQFDDELEYTRSKQIMSLVKDSQDNLWVATLNGVCLLNSQGCEIVKEINSACQSSGKNSQIHLYQTIFDMKRNLLWIATNNGLVRWNLKKEKISRCFLSSKYLYSITIDKNNSFIWVGHKDGEITRIKNEKNPEKFFVSTENVRNLIPLANGFILASTRKEIFIYSPEQKQWSGVNLTHEINEIYSINITRDGHLLIGTDKGLYLSQKPIQI